MKDVKELLNDIKEKIFSGVDLSGLPKMTDDERREFLLQQAERLLSTKENLQLVKWLTPLFIDKSKRDFMPAEDNPLWRPYSFTFNSAIDGLTDDEIIFARFATRLAYFVHCMYTRYGEPFNVNVYLGEEMDERACNDDDEDEYDDEFDTDGSCMEWLYEDDPESIFTLDNTPLTDWIKLTPYRRVAVGVMSIMITTAGEKAQKLNSVEQDYYFRFYGFGYVDLENSVSCYDYVRIGFETLERGAEHLRQAQYYGLDREGGSVVDALCCNFSHDYPKKYVECAKVIQQIATQMLPENSRSMDRTKRFDWTQAVSDAFDEELKKYDIDLNTREYNLARNYILDWLDLKYNAKMYGMEF
jgi:hypothetical protein